MIGCSFGGCRYSGQAVQHVVDPVLLTANEARTDWPGTRFAVLRASKT